MSPPQGACRRPLRHALPGSAHLCRHLSSGEKATCSRKGRDYVSGPADAKSTQRTSGSRCLAGLNCVTLVSRRHKTVAGGTVCPRGIHQRGPAAWAVKGWERCSTRRSGRASMSDLPWVRPGSLALRPPSCGLSGPALTRRRQHAFVARAACK